MTTRRSLRQASAIVVLACCPWQTASAQFATSVVMEELDGVNGFIIRGVEYGQFAVSLAGLGDVNADGASDVGSGHIGQWAYDDCYCQETPGMVHAIFGGPTVARDGLWCIDELDSATGIHVPEIGFRTCHGNVAAAGDFNNDGVDDFLASANCSSPGGLWWAGECYVIYGGSGVAGDGSLDVGALDGGNGFVIYGATPDMGTGARMAPAADFNGDGVDDIMFGNVSATVEGKVHAGQVYVLWGGRGLGDSGVFHMQDWSPRVGLIINGKFELGYAGQRVAPLGDFNGDGWDDIIIGASVQTPPGESYVVYGGPGLPGHGVLDLADLDGSNGFVLRAPAGEKGGMRVAGPGDVNGDGYAEAATYGESGVPVVFGGPAVAPDGVLELGSLDGTNGFVILTEGGYGSASEPAYAGDLNADGYAEVAVRVVPTYIVLGGPQVGSSGKVVVNQPDGRNVFKVDTLATRNHSGVGDVNGDGIDDFASTVIWEQHFWTGVDYGTLYVLFGRRMGDADLDADLDLADIGRMQVCFHRLVEGDVPDECHPFDFDRDNDVDQADHAAFAAALTGPQ